MRVAPVNIVKSTIAFSASLATTYILASIFYTMQILSAQAQFGATYTPQQQAETYLTNFTGLWLYGVMIAIALGVAFVVAWMLKKALKPLALLAYPIAGGAAIYVLLILVESQLGGGAGIIGGARTATGVLLQCLTGVAGGITFSILMRMRP